eukprot:GHVS01055956.1.p1 GENE.GHVS01055956.1~~GHVS01055956.1.p1  ORF type:complete len:414 (-),score=100.06 GHVS01055956.1:241-1323(-)
MKAAVLPMLLTLLLLCISFLPSVICENVCEKIYANIKIESIEGIEVDEYQIDIARQQDRLSEQPDGNNSLQQQVTPPTSVAGLDGLRELLKSTEPNISATFRLPALTDVDAYHFLTVITLYRPSSVVILSEKKGGRGFFTKANNRNSYCRLAVTRLPCGATGAASAKLLTVQDSTPLLEVPVTTVNEVGLIDELHVLIDEGMLENIQSPSNESVKLQLAYGGEVKELNHLERLKWKLGQLQTTPWAATDSGKAAKHPPVPSHTSPAIQEGCDEPPARSTVSPVVTNRATLRQQHGDTHHQPTGGQRTRSQEEVRDAAQEKRRSGASDLPPRYGGRSELPEYASRQKSLGSVGEGEEDDGV